MEDVGPRIRSIEREIERLKTQFSLGKASLDFSKKKIKELEKQLSALARQLPEAERDTYLLRKEFGKELL